MITVFRIFEIDNIQISIKNPAINGVYIQTSFVNFSGEIIFSKNKVQETLCYITNLAMLTGTSIHNMLIFGNNIRFLGNNAQTGLLIFTFCLICFIGFLIGPSFGETTIVFNLNMLVSNNTFDSFF